MSSKIQGIGVRKMKKIQFLDKKNVISENVRLLRVKNQLTQQDLAAKSPHNSCGSTLKMWQRQANS